LHRLQRPEIHQQALSFTQEENVRKALAKENEKKEQNGQEKLPTALTRSRAREPCNKNMIKTYPSASCQDTFLNGQAAWITSRET